MHVLGRVIASPPNKDVPATAQLTHPGKMLPVTVTSVKHDFSFRQATIKAVPRLVDANSPGTASPMRIVLNRGRRNTQTES